MKIVKWPILTILLLSGCDALVQNGLQEKTVELDVTKVTQELNTFDSIQGGCLNYVPLGRAVAKCGDAGQVYVATNGAGDGVRYQVTDDAQHTDADFHYSIPFSTDGSTSPTFVANGDFNGFKNVALMKAWISNKGTMGTLNIDTDLFKKIGVKGFTLRFTDENGQDMRKPQVFDLQTVSQSSLAIHTFNLGGDVSGSLSTGAFNTSEILETTDIPTSVHWLGGLKFLFDYDDPKNPAPMEIGGNETAQASSAHYNVVIDLNAGTKMSVNNLDVTLGSAASLTLINQ
jgi:hypothetical protein